MAEKSEMEKAWESCKYGRDHGYGGSQIYTKDDAERIFEVAWNAAIEAILSKKDSFVNDWGMRECVPLKIIEKLKGEK